MLEKINFIQNIGRYERTTATPDLSKLTLGYSENGRGKTTLCEILRSLALNRPNLIHERKRLDATTPEKVVVTISDTTYRFENGAWHHGGDAPRILVFDDQFVDENVHSGLTVAPGHRKNIHEIVLGSEGVAYQVAVQSLTDQIAELQRDLSNAEKAITPSIRGHLTFEAFCNLEIPLNLDEAIANAVQTVATISQAAEVANQKPFEVIEPPTIDIDSLAELLRRTLADVHAATVEKVQKHFKKLGDSGERWVADGLTMLQSTGASCPFCEQLLSDSLLFEAYEKYFSDEYSAHVEAITEKQKAIAASFSGDALSDVRVRIEATRARHTFWTTHTLLPGFEFDAEAFESAWKTTREYLSCGIDGKVQHPLAIGDIASNVLDTFRQFNALSTSLKQLSEILTDKNPSVRQVQEKAKHGSLEVAKAELQRLQVCKRRSEPANASLCDTYRDAKARKEESEAAKKSAKEALTRHRARMFPEHQTSINKYLLTFNAGFTITAFQATDPKGQPSSDFQIGIDSRSVALTSATAKPSFKTALSAGDRNTLALAFFFSMLEKDGNLSESIVIIDDPASSLDDGRRVATAQEIRSLCDKTKQVIVTSHSKPLLCEIFEHARDCASFKIVDSGMFSSDFAAWDVTADAITEYDRRHKDLRAFVSGGAQDPRSIAQSLRPLLEAFLRTACVAQYSAGKMLGQFVNEAKALRDNGSPIICNDRLVELEKIKEYANRFHHDNAGWQQALANLNRVELNGYANRTLEFTKVLQPTTS